MRHGLASNRSPNALLAIDATWWASNWVFTRPINLADTSNRGHNINDPNHFPVRLYRVVSSIFSGDINLLDTTWPPIYRVTPANLFRGKMICELYRSYADVSGRPHNDYIYGPSRIHKICSEIGVQGRDDKNTKGRALEQELEVLIQNMRSHWSLHERNDHINEMTRWHQEASSWECDHITWSSTATNGLVDLRDHTILPHLGRSIHKERQRTHKTLVMYWIPKLLSFTQTNISDHNALFNKPSATLHLPFSIITFPPYLPSNPKATKYRRATYANRISIITSPFPNIPRITHTQSPEHVRPQLLRFPRLF